MTSNSSYSIPDRVPAPIVRTLRRLIFRARLVIALRGIGAVAALAVGLVLAVMAIDAGVVIFSIHVRYALTLMALTTTAAGAAWFLVRPLARSFTLDGVARAIELHHPELQERISSAVELLNSRDSSELRGSEALIGLLVREASDDVRTISPAREITLRRARLTLLLAVAFASLLGGLLLAWPTKAQRLLLRAVAPNLNLPNISADELAIAPGDIVITQGQALRITVAVAGKTVRGAELRVPAADGTEPTTPMKRAFDPEHQGARFTFTCPPAERTFRYRIHAGDALSRYYTVRVVPFPAVTGIDLRYEYPAYTHLPPRHEQDASGDIAAVAGTEVTVVVKTNTAVQNGELAIDAQAAPATRAELAKGTAGTTDCVFRLKLTAGLAGRWKPKFTDVYGFSNIPAGHDIMALPDAPPAVAILEPQEKKLRLAPGDQVPLWYAVGDDFGLSGAEIVLESDHGKLPSMPLLLSANGGEPQRAAEGTAVLDLASLDLRGARQLTFRLRATDNLPQDVAGPQEGLSEPYTIDLDVKAPTYAEQWLVSWEQQVRQALEGVLKELKAAKNESTQALPDVSKPGRLSPPAQERIASMLKHLDTAAGSARELAQQVEWSPYASLAPRLNAVTDDHISKAQNLTGQVKLAEEPEERGKLADESDVQIVLAEGAVSAMLKEFDAMAEAARRQLELEEMAQSETELADAKKAMEQPAGGDQAAMTPDDWRRQQGDLAGQVDATLGESVQGLVRDFAAEARELKKQQDILTGDTRQLQALQEANSALASLAEEQEKLAKDAADAKAGAGTARLMSDAARDIRADQLPQAVAEQAEAARDLGVRAGTLRAELQTAELAKKVEAVAQQQKELGQQAQQAKQAQSAGQGVDQAAQAGFVQRQQQLAKQMNDLKTEARNTGWIASHLFDQDPTQPMQQAAQGAQGGKLDSAAQEATKAAEAAGKLAEAFRKTTESFARVENKEQKSQQFADLTTRQLDLQRRTMEAANRRRDALVRTEHGALARLQREQAEVALDAAELAERVRNSAPQQDQIERQAAIGAAQAARRLEEVQLPEAATAATEAGRKMSELAKRLHEETAPTAAAPATDAATEAAAADETAQLAERQERLAREIQTFQEAEYSDLAASREAGLEERTAGLEREVGEVRDRVQDFAPEDLAAQNAKAATEHLGHAGRAQHSAGEAIAGGRPREALPVEQESSAALEAAARALDDMGRRLAEMRDREELSRLGVPDAPEIGDLAQASQDANEAARTQQADAAARAAQHLSAAGQKAAARGLRMGVRPSWAAAHAAMPGYVGNSHRGIGPQRTGTGRVPSQTQLEDLGVTLDDWAKLPGELRDEILQGAGEDSPKEYRLLIKQYFEAVARQGAGKKPGGAE